MIAKVGFLWDNHILSSFSILKLSGVSKGGATDRGAMYLHKYVRSSGRYRGCCHGCDRGRGPQRCELRPQRRVLLPHRPERSLERRVQGVLDLENSAGYEAAWCLLVCAMDDRAADEQRHHAPGPILRHFAC